MLTGAFGKVSTSYQKKHPRPGTISPVSGECRAIGGAEDGCSVRSSTGHGITLVQESIVHVVHARRTSRKRSAGGWWLTNRQTLWSDARWRNSSAIRENIRRVRQGQRGSLCSCYYSSTNSCWWRYVCRL